MLPELSEEEKIRYMPHLTIPETGMEGQRKIESRFCPAFRRRGIGIGHIAVFSCCRCWQDRSPGLRRGRCIQSATSGHMRFHPAKVN
jgi:hypothetical protein